MVREGPERSAQLDFQSMQTPTRIYLIMFKSDKNNLVSSSSLKLRQIIHKCMFAVLCHFSLLCRPRLLLVIGVRRSLASCLFSSLFQGGCDVQDSWERPNWLRITAVGLGLARGARKQPFHLLHSEAVRVSMESRSKALRLLRWQWQSLACINADARTSGKFNWGSYGEHLQHPKTRHMSDNQWFSVSFWKWRQIEKWKRAVYREHEGKPREGQI